MMTMLFDKSVFPDPFPNQVFAKAFDVYFFVEYPLWQYNKEEIFNPFYFLNNIQETSIAISNLDDSKLLNYTRKAENWEVKDYFEAFNTTFTNERYLFWQGKHQHWAMVADTNQHIAVIGIDWDKADQVALFFANCMLSPLQVIQLLNLGDDEAVFLKNYAPSQNLTIGNDQNPVWVKYYFEARVENENDKLFYWKQFEPLYQAITAALPNCKSIDMYACQSFDRRYKQNGMIYSTGKFAPVGGWQKYSYQNCQKVATKFLTENEHLSLKFEGKTEDAEALYWANKNGLIQFMEFWVYANEEKAKTKGQLSDFHFITYHYNFGNLADTYNQNFQFSYKKSLMSDQLVASLVNELVRIGFVKKIHRLEKPRKFVKYSKTDWPKIEGMYSATPDLEGDSDLFQTFE